MTERGGHILQIWFVLCGIVVAGELFGGAEWMTESGIIHFIAVGFVAFAASRMFSKRIASDHDFHPLARALTLSMAMFALTHAIEYLSGSVLPLSLETEMVVIANLYMAAIFVGILGATRMINATKVRLPIGGPVMALLGLNLLIVVVVLLPAVGAGLPANAGMVQASLLVFTAAFIFAMWVLSILFERIPILVRFVREIMVAYAVVFISIWPEPLMDLFGGGAVPEYRAEVISHYIFYLGMAVFFVSFDRLRMFGGIYSELEEAKA